MQPAGVQVFKQMSLVVVVTFHIQNVTLIISIPKSPIPLFTSFFPWDDLVISSMTKF